MTKKINHHRAPMKRPSGKQAPLAGEVFAEKAKQKQIETREQKLSELEILKIAIITTINEGNKIHFGLATGILGGGVATNFIALQGDADVTLPAKAVTSLVICGSIMVLNQKYFFLSGVYKEMLRTTNDMIAKVKKGEDIGEVPTYGDLLRSSTIIREKKIEDRVKLKSMFNKKLANTAAAIMTGTALATVGYQIVQNMPEKEESASAMEQPLVVGETQKKDKPEFRFDPVLPGP